MDLGAALLNAVIAQRDAALNDAARAQARAEVAEAETARLAGALREAHALLAELQRPKPQE